MSHRKRRIGGHYGVISPCPLKRGQRVGEVLFDSSSITGNFTVNQDRLQTIYCSYTPTQKIQSSFP